MILSHFPSKIIRYMPGFGKEFKLKHKEYSPFSYFFLFNKVAKWWPVKEYIFMLTSWSLIILYDKFNSPSDGFGNGSSSVRVILFNSLIEVTWRVNWKGSLCMELGLMAVIKNSLLSLSIFNGRWMKVSEVILISLSFVSLGISFCNKLSFGIS